MYIIYQIFYIIGIFFYIAFMFIFKDKRRKGIPMRLGFYPEELIKKLGEKQNIWIHAVSVGEVTAVKALVDRIKKDLTGYNIVVSTITETGNDVAKKIMKDDAAVIYLPFDITYAIQRAIKFIKPAVFIIIETEIWPNLLKNLRKANIPALLSNGRISPASYRQYILIRPILKNILNYITLFHMQSKGDAGRIISLGADPRKVSVVGNMKFDNADFYIDEEKRQKMHEALALTNKKLIVAGSTHPDEEDILLKAYKNLSKNHNDLCLLIAPRHIERADEIAKLIKFSGFTPVKISYLTIDHRLSPSGRLRFASHSTIDCPVYILDTIGELKLFYSLAWLVFVGGSLVKHGGQNMIEPAYFSKPIIFGPNMFNFKDIAALFLKEKAAIEVKDKASFAQAAAMLYENKLFAEEMGKRARTIVDDNRGATDKTLTAIKDILEIQQCPELYDKVKKGK